MADLRGQQLKDSYQDVVTDSGSDLAGIENGNGIDITARIVERGSNSDGEWVRYADGTQIASIVNFLLEYSNPQVLRAVWNFPVSFDSSTRCILVSGNASEGKPNSNEGWFLRDTSFTGDNGTRCRLVLGGSSGTFSSGNTVTVNAIAIGRWK